ncbi:hypothetical protein CR51_36015 [Caballeronia megalochromosomata]|nr:hypothetical protein CR51_36015 [Caballeronia megalochromosomata]
MPLAPLEQATFPFDIQHSWFPSPSRQNKAESAHRIFKELWRGHQDHKLSARDIQDTFFQGISDLISYREGWHSGRYWSVNAWETARKSNAVTNNGLIAEHVLPRTCALGHALQLDEQAAGDFVWKSSFYCMITEDENKALTRAGRAAAGSPDNPWERYKHDDFRIMILDVKDGAGNTLIPEAERDNLNELGLLEPWDAKYGMRCEVPLTPA